MAAYTAYSSITMTDVEKANVLVRFMWEKTCDLDQEDFVYVIVILTLEKN